MQGGELRKAVADAIVTVAGGAVIDDGIVENECIGNARIAEFCAVFI